jgi:hypothetical protein
MSDKPEQLADTGRNDEAAPAVRVECYAGYRAEESPQRFFIGTHEIQVTEIIDRWLDPHRSHFKVRGGDGGIYILRYDHDTDTWDLVLYNSGKLPEMRLSST